MSHKGVLRTLVVLGVWVLAACSVRRQPRLVVQPLAEVEFEQETEFEAEVVSVPSARAGEFSQWIRVRGMTLYVHCPSVFRGAPDVSNSFQSAQFCDGLDRIYVKGDVTDDGWGPRGFTSMRRVEGSWFATDLTRFHRIGALPFGVPHRITFYAPGYPRNGRLRGWSREDLAPGIVQIGYPVPESAEHPSRTRGYSSYEQYYLDHPWGINPGITVRRVEGRPVLRFIRMTGRSSFRVVR